MKYLALYETLDEVDEDTQVARLERQLRRCRRAFRRAVQRLRHERTARAAVEAASRRLRPDAFSVEQQLIRVTS